MRALVVGEVSEARLLLLDAGLGVQHTTAADAAEHLKSARYNVLIVDARAGVEIVRELVPLAGGTPLIARVSEAARAGDALWAGAVDAVVLPGDEERLRARVRLSDEKPLQATADHLLAFVERAADAMFTHRIDGTISYANPAFVTMLGYTETAQLLGRPVLELVHAEDRDLVRERIASILQTNQPTRPGTVRFISRQGMPVYVETRGSLVGDRVTVIARDLGERRALEEQLQQSQKMEVVGRLAGGIAHDFNNILTTIRGYGDLLLERVSPGSPAADAAQHIRRSAIRASLLTEQLLVFTRRRPPQARLVQLNDVVRQMGGLLVRVIGEDIQLQLHLQPFLAKVRVDPGQMEQMILNLAINARDAMEKGGHLIIATRDHGHDQVRLTVEDDGCGIDEETRRRIFEPFFTTKAAGKGTGLGLSIVHAIVEQSGGKVRVESEASKGARFHILLPRAADSDAPPERLTPATLPPGPRGSETILLAEDDDEVREFVQHVLQRAGYRVLTAPDGAAALHAAQTFEGEIALLLSDVVMPRVNGRQLAAELEGMRPSLKVLHMSGYPGDTIARYGDVRDGSAFLQKPFTAGDLTRKVREILDAGRAAT